MRHWLLLLIAAVVVAGIAYTVVWIFTGGEEGLAPNEPDGRAVPLPGTRPLAEGDINATRFDTALRGYRMAQVDAALRRTAYDIGYKQELIDVLEAEIDALRAGRRSDADRLRAARLRALAGTDTAGGGRHTAVETDEDESVLPPSADDVEAGLRDYPTAEYEGVHSDAFAAVAANTPADGDEADGSDADPLGASVLDGEDDAVPAEDDADREAAVAADSGAEAAVPDAEEPDDAPAGAGVGVAEHGADGPDGEAAVPGDAATDSAAQDDPDDMPSEDGTPAAEATDATGGKTTAAAGRTRSRRAATGAAADKVTAAADGDGGSGTGRGRKAAAKGSRTAPLAAPDASGGGDGAADGAVADAADESSVHKAASGR